MLFFFSSPHVWWGLLRIFPSICRFPLVIHLVFPLVIHLVFPLVIHLVFPLVIHLSIPVSSKHLFISIASLLWIESTFLTRIQVCHHDREIFPFFSVALSVSRRIFALGPSLIPCNSFSTLFIHSAFLFFPFPHFAPKLSCFLCIRLLVVFVHSPPTSK